MIKFLAPSVAVVAFGILAQVASACSTTTVYRGLINRVGHDTYPIGSSHNISTSRGSITLRVEYRTAPGLGWQLPNRAMSRLGFISEVSHGTACVNWVR